MTVWLALLILSAQSTAPIEQAHSLTVFEADFEPSTDLNYDQWPDNWTRRRGMGFPQYVSIQIADDVSSKGEPTSCLRIDLDGGGAAAFSPPIDISPYFSYVFHGKIKTVGLKYNIAYFTVSFYNEDRSEKETHVSTTLTDALQWQELSIGPLTPENPNACVAIIGLHLVPTTRSDLTGSALFDDLRFARLPSMTLETAQPHNLFVDPRTTEVTCRVSGIQQPNATVLLELLDMEGRTIEQDYLRLSEDAVLAGPADDDAVSAPGMLVPRMEAERLGGVALWQPRIPDFGFYHVRASLNTDNRVTLQKTLSLVIMRRSGALRKGEFGWVIPRDGFTLSDSQLLQLLNTAHNSWVKYPIWHAPENVQEGERIATLADQLSATGIEMVGVFDEPPPDVFRRYGSKEKLSVAEAFLDPNMWQPAIDPLMIRLSLKIHWWQLGTDNDESFIDYQQLEQKVAEIRQHLKKYGQRIRLGLAWKWLHEPPVSSNPPWDFLAMTESPAFTNAELSTYIAARKDAHPEHWATLQPLPRGAYDTTARAQDLVLRMIESKISGAPAIFLANPFDPTHGLLYEDGTPNDLFLPWSITAQMISGAKYLGSLQLPQGSDNHVFERNGKAVMVVWNATPVTESLYLGDRVVQVDPWGRETILSIDASTPGHPQDVSVGPLPTFITGLNLAVARWRLNFKFASDRLDSTYGNTQTVNYDFQNTFPQGVDGTLEVHAPDVWEMRSPQLRFKLAPEDGLNQDLGILLYANASSGPQPLRIDFDVFADKQYVFSIYRTLNVGLGDLHAELNTWMDDDGRLIVEQHLMNQTGKRMDFNCYLFAPGRRRMRIQVFDIGPGRVTHTFALQNGKELLGQSLWLRVEELKGERFQNYHVIAEP